MYDFFHFLFSDEMEKIKIPKDMDDAKALGTVLSKYKDTYYSQVLVAYFATYVLYPLISIYLPTNVASCQCVFTNAWPKFRCTA